MISSVIKSTTVRLVAQFLNQLCHHVPLMKIQIKKVKWSRYRPGVALRVGRGIALLSHDRGTRRRWVVSSTPRPLFTPGKTRYALYRRLGGPQGRSGRAENLVPIGIRSRTVQTVAQSLYRLRYPVHNEDTNILVYEAVHIIKVANVSQ